MTSARQGSAESELKLAFDAYRRGDLGAAALRVDAVLAQHPYRADARLAKGTILMAEGQDASALTWLLEVLQAEPQNPEALWRAAFLSLNLRQFAQAEQLARALTEVQPDGYRAHYLLASSLRGLDRVPEALAEIDRALALKPDDLDCLVTKARLLNRWKLPGLATEVYRRVLAIRPFPPAGIDLAEILLRESHPEEALSLLRSVEPQLAEADRPYALMAQAHTELRQDAEADRSWALAEQFARDPVAVVLRRATSEISVGRFEAAELRLRAAIANGSRVSSCFSILTTARKMTAEDASLIERVVSVLATGELSEPDAAQLNYALGKTFDDLGEFGRAITYFDEANRISYELSPHRRNFSREAARAFTDFQIEFFAPERFEAHRGGGIESRLPLFVLGMMRSGTTLTEHILSAHSRIKDGGEQSFWTERVDEYMDWQRRSFDFARAVEYGREYLRLVQPKQQGIEYVVDKNPGNTMLAAMLHCLYPNAKIVHVKRHPVDNLLSMWMTPVSGNVAYASNRDNLVFTYREYLRLLAHLHNVLPLQCFRTFNYEDITSTPNQTVRAMLDHLGLEAEPACFSPETNLRTVLTPSVYQVRQPIHTASHERWKRYEPWLGPFAELLEA